MEPNIEWITFHTQWPWSNGLHMMQLVSISTSNSLRRKSASRPSLCESVSQESSQTPNPVSSIFYVGKGQHQFLRHWLYLAFENNANDKIGRMWMPGCQPHLAPRHNLDAIVVVRWRLHSWHWFAWGSRSLMLLQTQDRCRGRWYGAPHGITNVEHNLSLKTYLTWFALTRFDYMFSGLFVFKQGSTQAFPCRRHASGCPQEQLILLSSHSGKPSLMDVRKPSLPRYLHFR